MSNVLSTLVAFVVWALFAPSAVATSLCEIMSNPAAFDHQTIEITAFVSHGFEDFTLFDPTCRADVRPIWVEYGGRFASGTIYCCGLGNERSRKEPLAIDGITTNILRDRNLKRFDALVQQEPDSVVHSTFRGRFFAGEKTELPGGTVWAGYGHFGLYSLFVIEQVLAVDPRKQRGIDYRASPDHSDISEVGCGSQPISDPEYAEIIAQQQTAESGIRAWAFVNPARVAAENLEAVVKSRPGLQLKTTRLAPGRMVFEGTLPGKQNKYYVVVSKPYWLTFYANQPDRIAWTVVHSEEFGCKQNEE